MFGLFELNLTTPALYIWAMVLRISSILGMPSSSLPLAGVGLEMLSFALGLDLFHAAKDDSKLYFSFVELNVMSASGSKNFPELFGSKITILQFVLFFCVCFYDVLDPELFVLV